MSELELMSAIKKLQEQIYPDELVSRDLVKNDWDTLVGWWKWWRWSVMPQDFLPENGTGGIMVEKNNTPIVAGFLYLTNSKVAILEWIVSNPEYREDDRKDAIELLINKAEEKSKDLGFEYMFSVGRSKQLIDSHKKLGWSVDKRHSYEITKKL